MKPHSSGFGAIGKNIIIPGKDKIADWMNKGLPYLRLNSRVYFKLPQLRIK